MLKKYINILYFYCINILFFSLFFKDYFVSYNALLKNKAKIFLINNLSILKNIEIVHSPKAKSKKKFFLEVIFKKDERFCFFLFLFLF